MFHNRSAQALTYDFFIAMAIFLLFASLLATHYYHSAIQIQDTMERNRIAGELFLASEIWFKEGYPKYWNESNVEEIGLANEGKINQTKMNMLSQLGYPKLISLLNLGTHNVQYTLYDKSGNIIFQFPENIDFSSAQNVYRLDRISVLEDQIVRIRTILWY